MRYIYFLVVFFTILHLVSPDDWRYVDPRSRFDQRWCIRHLKHCYSHESQLPCLTFNILRDCVEIKPASLLVVSLGKGT